MEEPAPKRARLSIEGVMLELDHEDDDGPMTVGSDDEFDDITCTEQQRDEWGIVDDDYNMITECNAPPPPSLSETSSERLQSPPPLVSEFYSAQRLDSALHTGSSTVPGSSTPLIPTSLSVTAPGGSTPSFTPPLSMMAPGGSIPPFPPCHSVTPLTDPSQVDPFSLPLCHYFSLPLSTLTSVLQSAMTLQQHAPPATLTTVGKQSPQRFSLPISRQLPVVAQRPNVPTVSRPRQQGVLHPSATQPGPSPRETKEWSSTLSPVDIAPFVLPVGPTV